VVRSVVACARRSSPIRATAVKYSHHSAAVVRNAVANASAVWPSRPSSDVVAPVTTID
jgi:hypothetical protein